MPNQFTLVQDFEQIIALSEKAIYSSRKGYELNFSIKVKFDIHLVQKPQLLDVVDIAKDYQSFERPQGLYINHGEYITEEGVPYVISELQNKHTGNRAIISLISQKDIVGSGDEPRPSFMILQFSVENSNELFVTTYFRALEVSRFLRINLEEIRMIVDQIYGTIRTIKVVKLNIFAFRAYVIKNMNPLLRPEIEQKDSLDVLKMMEHSPSDLVLLLKEKYHNSTVIEIGSLEIINRIINDDKISRDIHPGFKSKMVKNLVSNLLRLSNELSDRRKRSSHDKGLSSLYEEYLKVMQDLTRELDQNI